MDDLGIGKIIYSGSKLPTSWSHARRRVGAILDNAQMFGYVTPAEIDELRRTVKNYQKLVTADALLPRGTRILTARLLDDLTIHAYLHRNGINPPDLRERAKQIADGAYIVTSDLESAVALLNLIQEQRGELGFLPDTLRNLQERFTSLPEPYRSAGN